MKQIDLNPREIKRIKHFCEKLNLNRWDTADVTEYIAKHFRQLNSDFSQEIYDDFAQIKSKILKLGIKNIVDEFEFYLGLESSSYDDWDKDSNLSEEEIWEEIYRHTDKIIEEEFISAKQMAKQEKGNKGCSVTILIIIASTLFVRYFLF